jgi:hypothetical protein
MDSTDAEEVARSSERSCHSNSFMSSESRGNGSSSLECNTGSGFDSSSSSSLSSPLLLLLESSSFPWESWPRHHPCRCRHHHHSHHHQPSASLDVVARWRTVLVGRHHRRRGASCKMKSWRWLSLLKKFFSHVICCGEEKVGLGLNIEHQPMRLLTNSI